MSALRTCATCASHNKMGGFEWGLGWALSLLPMSIPWCYAVGLHLSVFCLGRVCALVHDYWSRRLPPSKWPTCTFLLSGKAWEAFPRCRL